MFFKINNTLIRSAAAVLLFVFVACGKSDDVQPETARTVMVYMAANNSLASDAFDNLNQMEAAYKDMDGKLLVYARLFGYSPRLYEIVYDESPEIKSKVLKTYADHNSSDPAIMQMVFNDLQQLAPSKSYGAILWSHATNWFPADLYLPKTRSFGDDNFASMDVQELKDALPRNLDFLMFDACSMASVEVLYELKDVTPYVLASPTEVLAVGMPYHQVAKHLFAKDVRTGLMQVAQSYHDYYQAQAGLYQSATFSLVETNQLSDLAAAMKNLLAKEQDQIPLMSRDGIQRMDLDPTTPVIAFDLLDMFEKNFAASAELEKLRLAIDRSVLFKTNTAQFLGKPIDKFSGLSSYFPVEREASLSEFYKTLSWTSDSGYDLFFHWETKH